MSNNNVKIPVNWFLAHKLCIVMRVQLILFCEIQHTQFWREQSLFLPSLHYNNKKINCPLHSPLYNQTNPIQIWEKRLFISTFITLQQ